MRRAAEPCFRIGCEAPRSLFALAREPGIETGMQLEMLAVPHRPTEREVTDFLVNAMAEAISKLRHKPASSPMAWFLEEDGGRVVDERLTPAIVRPLCQIGAALANAEAQSDNPGPVFVVGRFTVTRELLARLRTN